jgi:hypothetical protein
MLCMYAPRAERGMKSFMIILVMAVLITSTLGNQVHAKDTHDARSNSTSGSSVQLQTSVSSSGSSPHNGHTKPLSNVTAFVEDCFTNNTGDAVNITVDNASGIIGHCFSLYNLEPINKATHQPVSKNSLGLGTLLAPGQLVVTGIKHPPMKHSAAYNIGYKLGSADGKIGGAGLPDGTGACNSGTGVNGTAATNQCLAGYFAAWNKYCPTSKYGCKA